MKVGFIGLGNMGRPMAKNQLRAGYNLIVFNRTRGRAEALHSEGNVQIADSPADAAKDADVLITMLADDHAVEDVILNGEKPAINSLRRNAIHVSMSTISVACSRRLKEAHEKAGQRYVAAPVFGRPEAAEAAKLSIVAAGPSDAVEECRPLFEAMGQKLFVIGDHQPNSNLIKISGNFMIASMLEALGESFALVRKSGIEAAQFLDIINTALFNSPIYKNYGTLIAEQRFDPPGFKLKLGLKDLRLTLAAADESEVPMPLASLVHDDFLTAAARGSGDRDWAAIAQVSADRAGL
jgi:3-hydroxyisobutyrate dehydrogenase-like beta-hydroxyacid dehydrogenase